MQWSMGMRLFVLVTFATFAMDAWAARRLVRVDAGGWQAVALGSADCPGATTGATAADTLVRRFGYVFAGHEHTEHLTNVYCEIAFDDGTVDPRDAASTAFGATVVSMVSYSFLDAAIAADAIGFQWIFTGLDDGTTLVYLNNVNLVDPTLTEVLDADSYIESEDGTELVWSGAGDNYDGEIFCFRNNAHVGTWDGAGTYANSPCALAAAAPVPVNVPTMGDATRGVLVLMLAALAMVALRRR